MISRTSLRGPATDQRQSPFQTDESLPAPAAERAGSGITFGVRILIVVQSSCTGSRASGRLPLEQGRQQFPRRSDEVPGVARMQPRVAGQMQLGGGVVPCYRNNA